MVFATPVVGLNPGFIINDNIFTNDQTMTVKQIQDFLNSKVPVCDTWGTGGSTATSRRDYIRSWGYDTPLTCLRDYKEGGKSSAQIIYDVAQKYHINPQVLIVLLQKEQGLVTDDWPGPWQYEKATGYGCPDTAPCDSQYYGLTNQLDWSGKMYRAIMNDSPTWYSPYVVGNNKIYYNPGPYNNATQSYYGRFGTKADIEYCGSSTVNIQNRATQALYDYTPYQPNQAALDAGYGSVFCGAYGNRNFYLYFSDWFGSPQFGNLVRTRENATVYLISDDDRYPIADASILSSLKPFGDITYVTQSYLDAKSLGRTLGRLITSSSGTIYYFDSGIKLAFKSCAQMVDYGYDCTQPALLSDYLIGSLSTGPSMTNVFQTTNGKRFYIKSGEKKEIYDDASLQKIGVSANSNTLNESAISNLSYGSPVIRDDVIVTSRETGSKYISQNGRFIKLSAYLLDSDAFTKLSDSKLDSASINEFTISKSFNGFAQNSTGKKYIIDSYGKTLLSNPEEWLGSYTTLTDTIFGLIPNSTQPVNSRFIKVDGESTIYMVIKGKKYSIPSWNDFLNLHIDKSTKWALLPKITADSIPTSKPIYAPGGLVKSSSSAAVYVINGLLQKIALSSFAVSDDFGIKGVITIPQDYVNIYATDNDKLNNFVVCDNKKYLANRGVIYEIDAKASTMYGYSSAVGSLWDDIGCVNLDMSSRLLSTYSFVKEDDSKTIYLIKDGKKHPISSMARYDALGGLSNNMLIVSNRVLNTIVDGPAV
ncbi:hypothetical protein COV88_00380 [Candidatus Saccharibacteria bacterium CG11_big_fil_rev_8_21_14_0_20_41_19]|nr:MAG: hypothetical protein AUK57_04055 [Candidatus Saccharibacteria bacterium CG2_30_41_52]PIQ71239.1 MAG: hypothetical protein COV88_00380 [Candidatus Saccharibacteria bacterium CG11_big_fil_rev_8_21_14_0_20_41_19]PIZ59814.1 MAG: hypothetical protein COY18_02495 [Candidatus Saccharibacteria bacterium CG_4_10_14_0_2_um_filter_41_11]PJC29842.1 MAG: hypothetical protein CO052_01095 [Candidatus Saccharibacteria bacterium CG_4_9_14_0_2_um_filter_41_9]PJE66460.1 MAG: hypothetical protein COU92_005